LPMNKKPLTVPKKNRLHNPLRKKILK